MDSLISAGFYLVKPSPRPEWASGNVLPPRIVSASDCLCRRFPGSYAIEWTSDAEDQRGDAFDAVGLPTAKRQSATTWATENFEQSFGWPCVFYGCEEAEAVRALFFPGDSDVQVIGLGLPAEFVDAFTECMTPPPPMPGFAPVGESGWLKVVKRRQPLPAGRLLGYELLNVEARELAHSWLCNHLEAHFASRQNIHLNELGLIDDLKDAWRCCEALQRDEVGAEPGPWFPWGLVRFG